ncbi:O-antigen ligase family protein [Polaribacter sp. R77954]|uniref:O-antigen ligase family protein n=1 Tax=Polaribacter sp. R77954 TaxID=3093870 RepID=UPI0037C9DADB
MQKEILEKNNVLLTAVKISIGFMFGIMLFSSITKSIIIALFGLTILLLVYKTGFTINRRLFFVNTLVYLIILLTIFYSSNLPEASLKLQTTFSLFLFPMLLSLLKVNQVREIQKNIKIYLMIFIVGTFLYNVGPFLWYYFTHYSFGDIIKHYPIIIIQDIGKYGIHPIYMSMHCVISILFSIFIFKEIKTKLNKGLLLIINLVLICFLIIYSKKGPIIGLASVLFIWSFFKAKNVKKYYFLAIFTIGILLISIPKTRNKFLELVKIEEAKSVDSNSTNIRFSIYKTAFGLIKKSPFFGYGIGDFNDQLRKEYKNNTQFLLSKEYNSHNQYLSFLLIGGIPLLLSFFYFLYYNINLSVNNKNYLLIIIISFYSIVMLSENILERENGVIFFSFLINFFSLKNFKKNE